jgi:hypothetical protein
MHVQMQQGDEFHQTVKLFEGVWGIGGWQVSPGRWGKRGCSYPGLDRESLKATA